MLRTPSLLGLGLLLGLMAGEASSRCLRFEPATVTLTGTLSERVLPGPPSYEHIARGDIPEKVLFLELDKPICVLGDPMMLRNTGTITGVEEVHVRITGFWQRTLIGKRTRATGTLFTAHLLAHRTPVVLTVIGVREVDD